MTANEFYGPELAQMRLAERQVLEAVEELQRVWKAQGRQSPVLYTSSRIKSPESMCRKLAQRGQPQTRQAALTRVRDAVGVRVICGFQDDVYQVARWLEDQAAFSVLETKDYISYPKENGYRSYHLILGLRAGPGRGMTVEVQLRTIAIDFWASLEHQLKYKRQVPHARLVREELRRCADEIASVDLSMETILTGYASGAEVRGWVRRQRMPATTQSSPRSRKPKMIRNITLALMAAAQL